MDGDQSPWSQWEVSTSHPLEAARWGIETINMKYRLIVKSGSHSGADDDQHLSPQWQEPGACVFCMMLPYHFDKQDRAGEVWALFHIGDDGWLHHLSTTLHHQTGWGHCSQLIWLHVSQAPCQDLYTHVQVIMRDATCVPLDKRCLKTVRYLHSSELNHGPDALRNHVEVLGSLRGNQRKIWLARL